MNTLNTFLNKLKIEAKEVLADAGSAAKKLWAQDKVFFAILVPLIAVICGRNILMSLIVSQAKKTINNATVQDNKLAEKENAANTEANALVQDSNVLPSQETKIDDDWYKK